MVTVLDAHNPEVGVDGLDVLIRGRHKKFLRSGDFPFRALDGEVLPVPEIARRPVEYALLNARLHCEAAERRNSGESLHLSWSEEDGCDAFLEGHGLLEGGNTPHVISDYCRTHLIPISVDESERCTTNFPRSYASHLIAHCQQFAH